MMPVMPRDDVEHEYEEGMMPVKLTYAKFR